MLADCCQMRKGETERGLLTSSLFPLPSSFFLLTSSLFLLPSSFFLLPSSFFLLPSAKVSGANSGELQFPIAIAIQGAIPCEQRAATDRLRGANQVEWRCRNCLAPSLSPDSRTQSQRQKNRPPPLESDCLSQERTILSEIHPNHRQLHLQADSPPQAIGRLPPMPHLTRHKLPQLWLLSLPAPAPPPQDLPTRLAPLTRRIFAPRFSE